jgi:phage FluMu protein Com
MVDTHNLPEGKKKYFCDLCEKDFDTIQDAESHENSCTLTKDGLFKKSFTLKCKVCDRLVAEITVTRPDKYKCPSCGTIYNVRDDGTIEYIETDSSMGTLEKLIEKRNAGEITSEEFEEMKKEILERKPQISREPDDVAQEEADVSRKDKDSVVSKSNVGAGGKSKAEDLREAKSLFEEGLIDESEYKQMKKEILGK